MPGRAGSSAPPPEDRPRSRTARPSPVRIRRACARLRRHAQHASPRARSAASRARAAPARVHVHAARATVPPASSAMSCARPIDASGTTASRSAPRSKRCDASVCSPWRLAVRRTLAGWKCAHSSSTRVVAGVTSLSAPPITPASASGRVAVADDQVVGVERALLAVERGQLLARLARGARRSALPASLSRSKACSGWPYSSST